MWFVNVVVLGNILSITMLDNFVSITMLDIIMSLLSITILDVIIINNHHVGCHYRQPCHYLLAIYSNLCITHMNDQQHEFGQ